jgi:hypothetical protein
MSCGKTFLPTDRPIAMPRAQFSVKTLLWLIVVVAAFSFVVAVVVDRCLSLADPCGFLKLPATARRLLLGRLHTVGLAIAIGAFTSAAIAAVYVVARLIRPRRRGGRNNDLWSMTGIPASQAPPRKRTKCTVLFD